MAADGINRVVLPVLRGAMLAAVVLSAQFVINQKAEADQQAADSRIAAAIADQAALVRSLGEIVTKCTSPGENFITIEDEVWACGATRTGIKVRP